MKTRITICSLVLSMMIIGTGLLSAKPASRIDQGLVAANNAFGIKLFKQIAAGTPGKNVFISPSSISSALNMTYNGAAGTTKSAMANTLELNGMSLERVNQGNLSLAKALKSADPKVELETANSLWMREGYPFRPAFTKNCVNYYDAKVSGLRGAPGTINAWVSQKTHGKIKDLVKEVDPLTVLFLVNATYFKGDWSNKFDKAKTHDANFHLSKDHTKSIKMMSQDGDHEYLKGDKFQALRLPYGNGSVSMYVFLPSEDSNLQAFSKTLTVQNWNRWMTGFEKTEVEIGLPKFKMEWKGQLNKPLKDLGMKDAFYEGHHDFTNMTPDKDCYIYQVLHKSFVQVDEEGTTAAAATSVEMRTKAMRYPSRMIVDRPFLCAIRHDKTGQILFMGAVVDPQ